MNSALKARIKHAKKNTPKGKALATKTRLMKKNIRTLSKKIAKRVLA